MGMPADTPLAEAANDIPATPTTEVALPKRPPFEARFARAIASPPFRVSPVYPFPMIILARWPPFVNCTLAPIPPSNPNPFAHHIASPQPKTKHKSPLLGHSFVRRLCRKFSEDEA